MEGEFLVVVVGSGRKALHSCHALTQDKHVNDWVLFAHFRGCSRHVLQIESVQLQRSNAWFEVTKSIETKKNNPSIIHCSE
jgi:hypothetical protein